jgi:hypothetical protein
VGGATVSCRLFSSSFPGKANPFWTAQLLMILGTTGSLIIEAYHDFPYSWCILSAHNYLYYAKFIYAQWWIWSRVLKILEANLPRCCTYMSCHHCCFAACCFTLSPLVLAHNVTTCYCCNPHETMIKLASKPNVFQNNSFKEIY